LERVALPWKTKESTFVGGVAFAGQEEGGKRLYEGGRTSEHVITVICISLAVEVKKRVLSQLFFLTGTIADAENSRVEGAPHKWLTPVLPPQALIVVRGCLVPG
jgi:hypothetical protein